MRLKKTLKSMLAFVMIAAVTISLTSCTFIGKSSRTKFNLSQSNGIHPAENVADKHLLKSEKLKSVVKSGLIELLFDEQTYSIAIKETSKGKFWTAIPTTANDKEKNYAATISLVAAFKDKTYYLNSQDHSVAFGTASYMKNEKGLIVTYVIAPSKEVAQKTGDKWADGEFQFKIPVTYELKDGSFFVSINCAKIESYGNIKLLDLGVLEYFGASKTAAEGDFLLVPDGVGAVIKPSIEDAEFQPIALKVYGEDKAFENNQNSNSTVVPAFGIKQADCAFAAIIEQGDALATVKADRQSGESGYNHIGTTFSITPHMSIEKNEKITRYISSDSYKGTLKLCYRFMTGNNASYSGIAAACREQIIRNRVLSTKSVSVTEYLPFNLTVVGAVKKDGFLGTLTKLTTFEQAQDMVVQMKAKGINNILMRYKGAFSGGLNQSNITETKFLGRLGSKGDFKELYDYMKTQKLELYLDINLVTASKYGTINTIKTAETIKGTNLILSAQNELSPVIGTENFSRRVLNLKKLEPSVIQLLTNTKDVAITGYCISDAGKVLYSDFSKGFLDRTQAAEMIALNLSPLTTSRKLMVDTGNFYALKNADVVVNLPLDTSRTSAAYEEIPFVPMILHGIVDYSGQPINMYEDFETAMLKSIEFGAVPSFEWYYEDIKNGTEGVRNFYYADWLTKASEYYTKANKVLHDLRDARMTKNYLVQDGLRCTEYNSSMVYINYTNEDFIINGVVIPARDFIRIN